MKNTGDIRRSTRENPPTNSKTLPNSDDMPANSNVTPYKGGDVTNHDEPPFQATKGEMDAEQAAQERLENALLWREEVKSHLPFLQDVLDVDNAELQAAWESLRSVVDETDTDEIDRCIDDIAAAQKRVKETRMYIRQAEKDYAENLKAAQDEVDEAQKEVWDYVYI